MPSEPVQWLAPEEIPAWIDRYDTFLFDCDGVIWLDDTVVPHVPETLALLRQKGKKLLFVSNNATKHRSDYLSKFKKMGIEATIDDVITSAVGAARYFVSEYGQGAKAFVCGSAGLVQELLDVGAQVVQPQSVTDTTPLAGGPALHKVDPEIKAVLAGADWNLTHRKLGYATVCLNTIKGCKLIATNGDPLFPAGDGNFYPGAGATVTPLELCSGQKATYIGKPGPMLLDILVKTQGMDKTKAIMIGDRLDTDIKFGNDGAVDTLVVLTGVTRTKGDAESAEPDYRPKYGLTSLGDLFAPAAAAAAAARP